MSNAEERLFHIVNERLRSALAKLCEYGERAPERLTIEERLALAIAAGCPVMTVQSGTMVHVRTVWKVIIRATADRFEVLQLGDG